MDTKNKNQNHRLQVPNPLGKDFWEAHWSSGQTGWDIGYASPPITTFMTGEENRDQKILIPGCGNAYEAEYLAREGFTDITLLDISPSAAAILEKKYRNIPAIRIICGDFYDHEEKYNTIIEQTFFCTMHPLNRDAYARQANRLLNDHGKLIGVLFNTDFGRPGQGPPFGGYISEYLRIFEPGFEIVKMEPAYNSIPPRAGTEVFIHLVKKEEKDK